MTPEQKISAVKDLHLLGSMDDIAEWLETNRPWRTHEFYDWYGRDDEDHFDVFKVANLTEDFHVGAGTTYTICGSNNMPENIDGPGILGRLQIKFPMRCHHFSYYLRPFGIYPIVMPGSELSSYIFFRVIFPDHLFTNLGVMLRLEGKI